MMKKQCAISIFVIVSLMNTIEASQPPRKGRKPAQQAKQSRQQTKPSMSDSDNEALYKQINFVNNYKESTGFEDYNEYPPLKDFLLKNLCPIRNWTQQDKDNTTKWLKTAFDIALRDPRTTSSGGMGNPFYLIRSLADRMFTTSSYFRALPPTNAKRQAASRDFITYVNKLTPDKIKKAVNYIGIS